MRESAGRLHSAAEHRRRPLSATYRPLTGVPRRDARVPNARRVLGVDRRHRLPLGLVGDAHAPPDGRDRPASPVPCRAGLRPGRLRPGHGDHAAGRLQCAEPGTERLARPPPERRPERVGRRAQRSTLDRADPDRFGGTLDRAPAKRHGGPLAEPVEFGIDLLGRQGHPGLLRVVCRLGQLPGLLRGPAGGLVARLGHLPAGQWRPHHDQLPAQVGQRHVRARRRLVLRRQLGLRPGGERGRIRPLRGPDRRPRPDLGRLCPGRGQGREAELAGDRQRPRPGHVHRPDRRPARAQLGRATSG